MIAVDDAIVGPSLAGARFCTGCTMTFASCHAGHVGTP